MDLKSNSQLGKGIGIKAQIMSFVMQLNAYSIAFIFPYLIPSLKSMRKHANSGDFYLLFFFLFKSIDNM